MRWKSKLKPGSGAGAMRNDAEIAEITVRFAGAALEEERRVSPP